jgi:DNA-directed RNA polymerase specialized sigma24 family protein
VDELLRYMKALVLLQLQTLPGTESPTKPEILLSRAGFPQKEIAEMLGKSPVAVAKTISRARAAQRKNASVADTAVIEPSEVMNG